MAWRVLLSANCLSFSALRKWARPASVVRLLDCAHKAACSVRVQSATVLLLVSAVLLLHHLNYPALARCGVSHGAAALWSTLPRSCL